MIGFIICFGLMIVLIGFSALILEKVEEIEKHIKKGYEHGIKRD